MKIGFVKTDGGLGQTDINDTADCAVRAYALYHDVPYAEAHALFKKSGRKNGQGTSFHIIEKLMGKPNLHFIEGKRITVKNLIAQNPKSTIYAIKRGHAFTIKSGVIHDTWQPGARCQVFQYWVKPEAKVEKPVVVVGSVRERAFAIYSILKGEKKSTAEIINSISYQLEITNANARYYVSRVFEKK
jgi:hypothetical protein